MIDPIAQRRRKEILKNRPHDAPRHTSHAKPTNSSAAPKDNAATPANISKPLDKLRISGPTTGKSKKSLIEVCGMSGGKRIFLFQTSFGDILGLKNTLEAKFNVDRDKFYKHEVVECRDAFYKSLA